MRMILPVVLLSALVSAVIGELAYNWGQGLKGHDQDKTSSYRNDKSTARSYDYGYHDYDHGVGPYDYDQHYGYAGYGYPGYSPGGYYGQNYYGHRHPRSYGYGYGHGYYDYGYAPHYGYGGYTSGIPGFFRRLISHRYSPHGRYGAY